jgi:hypothetical protein
MRHEFTVFTLKPHIKSVKVPIVRLTALVTTTQDPGGGPITGRELGSPEPGPPSSKSSARLPW